MLDIIHLDPPHAGADNISIDFAPNRWDLSAAAVEQIVGLGWPVQPRSMSYGPGVGLEAVGFTCETIDGQRVTGKVSVEFSASRGESTVFPVVRMDVLAPTE